MDGAKGMSEFVESVVVAKSEELEEGKQLEVKANGKKILLYRGEGDVYAISGICTHMGRPIAGGRIKNCIISCPWHAGKYDLKTGKPVELPAFKSIPIYAAEETDGEIRIHLQE